jgi:uncharacterized low-complexity protein
VWYLLFEQNQSIELKPTGVIMAYAKKPLAAALGAAFLASTLAPIATAEVNPFSATQLSGGYDLVNFAGHAEGKCGEGKCGESKKAEGKCGEGKCGESKKAEGKCGEGKCGEGKCGESKKAEGKCGEGKCGESKKAEGKCGEGKCGGDK